MKDMKRRIRANIIEAILEKLDEIKALDRQLCSALNLPEEDDELVDEQNEVLRQAYQQIKAKDAKAVEHYAKVVEEYADELLEDDEHE